MTEQLAIDFVSAPAFRQVGRREYVLRRVCENLERFRPGFYDWLKVNLEIWEAFEAEALRVLRHGRTHYSSRTLWEVMRHETGLRAQQDGTWKLNNDRAPDVARLFLLMNPDKPGFFETRGRE